MNAFDTARLVEARGMAILEPFLRQRADGRLVIIQKGPLSEFLQRSVGDALMNVGADGAAISVEIKIEQANHHGNLFLETWSNKNLNDRVSHATRGSSIGWMYTLRADWLLYYFLDDDELYIADFFKLRQWAHGSANNKPNLWHYPELAQTKRGQLNDTWGRCVPIDVLSRALMPSFRLMHPRALLADMRDQYPEVAA